jgi:TonB family protein
MPLELQCNPEETLGSLCGCLLEGDREQRTRERRIRRRALAMSIALQSAALAALVLIPLFGKTERIALANVTQVPPYSTGRAEPVHAHPTPPGHRDWNRTDKCWLCAPHVIPPRVSTEDPGTIAHEIDDSFQGVEADGSSFPGGIPLADSRPHPPTSAPAHHVKPEVVHLTSLDPAMLIRRVEPVYPTLPRQMGRGGRVELRAIIATDGTIQSLQVISGDPLVIQSALQAVQQWRYRPTILNGQRVEIDTFITVVYNINR